MPLSRRRFGDYAQDVAHVCLVTAGGKHRAIGVAIVSLCTSARELDLVSRELHEPADPPSTPFPTIGAV